MAPSRSRGAPSARVLLASLALVAFVGLVRPTFADDEKGADKAKDEPPALVSAEKGPFAVVLDLDATLDAKESVAVELHTEVFGDELKVKSAPVLAPTMVKAGDTLVVFDAENIDDQLAAARQGLELGRLAFDRAREDAARDQAERDRTLARLLVARERAVEELAYFNRVDRARRVTEGEIELKANEDSVTDQVEELDQLKKMYKADDVVEETESIVMKRSERSLDRSRKYLAIRREANARLLAVELPRELEDLEHAATRATAEHARQAAAFPMELEKSRRELAKAELELALEAKRLARLEKDRGGFELKAPVAGLAVPGVLTDGTWSGGDDVVRSLRDKEGLKPHQTLFTIVVGTALVVRARVPESSILDVAPGQKSELKLAAAPTRKLVASVASVARTSKDGKFDVVFDLDATDERWMPGFAGALKLTTATRADAVTVPEDSVVTKGDVHRVHVWVDGKSVAREVEVGATSAGRTEILKGLEAGTKVLESPPK